MTAGTSTKQGHFVLHHLADIKSHPLFTQDTLYLGALVPKRWAKRAVRRNLVKRQIYSVAALYQYRLKAQPYVVRLQRGFDSANHPSAGSIALKRLVRAELEALFGRSSHGNAASAAGALSPPVALP